jgi:ADP-ribosyl-[dinitrogen reductase] hydrolase
LKEFLEGDSNDYSLTYRDIDWYFGKGLCSDDTEHACMTAEALIMSKGRDEIFPQKLAWKLRFWLLSLPAGTGAATAKSILKLLIGFSPKNSGVFSAGNGPAMRSPILGVCFGSDFERLRVLVRASTQLTHSDPKAEYGALAVALAAYLASINNGPIVPSQYLDQLHILIQDPEAEELFDLLHTAALSAKDGEDAAMFTDRLGLGNGVTGYIYDTVPVVIHVWFRFHHDFPKAILETIKLGGDTDTTAAILGGIIGAKVGKRGIPEPWLENLWEWPRSIGWMEQLGVVLADTVEIKSTGNVPHIFFPAVFARNLLFLVIVLAHGFRRIFPPY